MFEKNATALYIYKLLNLTNIPAFRSSAARKKVRIIILISNKSYSDTVIMEGEQLKVKTYFLSL